ncbi:MAG: hypothetical protein QXY84_02980 [Candidatus Caldarchaeum sp.]|uniref:Uncharacterized protein n=1 Tax=Caldiarchaeum subterraneum TaxID=311458 RepID=A0A7C5U961_CALS0
MLGFLKKRNEWVSDEKQAAIEPFEITEEFRARVEKAITTLNAHIERLNNKYREMHARSREYFERTVEALQAKDDGKAKIYAGEIAEIRKLAGIVLHSQLVLLQVKIRLESILELGEALTLIRPLAAMLGNVVEEIRDVAPEASENLRNLMVLIDDFMSSAGVYVEPTPEKSAEVSDEVSFILDEARKMAAEKVRQSFPEAPKLTNVETLVYRFVLDNNVDELDLETCASKLNLDAETVSEALKSLHEKGLIQLELAESS